MYVPVLVLVALFLSGLIGLSEAWQWSPYYPLRRKKYRLYSLESVVEQ